MTYLKVIIFLAFSLFLFLFPARLYTNRKFRRAWLGMAYSENFRLFTARLLCLALILFHLVYYALFPLEKGIMLSSIYVFFSLASKKNIILLQTIRMSRIAIMALAVIVIAISFVPHLLSVAVTLAFILETVCCFPSKLKHRNAKTQKTHAEPTDTEKNENVASFLKTAFMEKNTHSLNWLALGAELIDCLRSKGNHRLTRYDAFVWMMEHIQKGVAVRDADGVVINTAPYSASYKRLAEDWNWERHAVQSFIEELTDLSVITSKRQGNVYAFFIGKKSYKQLVL